MYLPQYIILFHHFRELLKKLNAEGITVMPLKGAHLLTTIYGPDENRGLLADVDFLVKRNDWFATLKIMQNTGFHARPHFTDETTQHEMGFMYPIFDQCELLFEVHNALFDPMRFPIDTDGIWRRASDATFEEVPCMHMADEDVFCYLAWHSAIHRFIYHKRTLGDLERILLRKYARQTDPRREKTLFEMRSDAELAVLLPRILERAAEWRCKRVVWLYLTLLQPRISNRVSSDSNQLMGCLTRNNRPQQPFEFLMELLIGQNEQTHFSTLHHRLQAALIWPIVFDDWQSLVRMLKNHPAATKLKSKVAERKIFFH